MTEEQLERRADIAKFWWMLCIIPYFVVAYLSQSIVIMGFLTVAWAGLGLILSDKYPDDIDRIRKRQGF